MTRKATGLEILAQAPIHLASFDGSERKDHRKGVCGFGEKWSWSALFSERPWLGHQGWPVTVSGWRFEESAL